MVSREEVLENLEKEKVGVLSSKGEEENIRLRVMYYGVDKGFNFYLMTSRDSPKVREITAHPRVSFLVYHLEEPFDRSWELEVEGRVKIVEKGRDLSKGLATLKGKNPFVDVAVEAGITDEFVILHLIPSLIRFRIYGDILKGLPPTVWEFP